MAPFLLPLLGLGGLFTFWRIFKKMSSKAKELIVLGPKAAGKTLWLCFQRNIKYEDKATFDKEKYPKFSFKKKNGETINIKSGYDYAGAEENVKTYYEQVLTTDTPKVVMFFFSLYHYLEDQTYKRDVVSRLGFIEGKFKSQLKKNNFYLIITYADKVAEYDSKAKTVTNELKINYKLSDLLSKANIKVINTTDNRELEDLKNKLDI